MSYIIYLKYITYYFITQMSIFLADASNDATCCNFYIVNIFNLKKISIGAFHFQSFVCY